MDYDSLAPVLAGLARHALTSVGGFLVSSGYLNSSEVSGFVGGGLIFLGMAWSWWQKKGQAQVAGLLKKLTKQQTTAAAVTVAEVTQAK